MSKAIYKFRKFFGRNGDLEGIFIQKKEHVNFLIENDIIVHFGEVLGKHSDIFSPIDSSNIQMVTDNEDAIEIIEKYKLENGINPFYYSVMDFDYDEYGINPDDLIDFTVQEIIDYILNKKA